MTAAERSPNTGLAPDDKDNLRVLVVEDDDSVRGLICRRLRQAGLDPIPAASGEEAIALCAADDPKIQLLITDGIMPGIDGFEVARWFGQRNPPVRAILISGFMGHFVSRTDIPANIEAFFPKPFSGEELVAKILDMLEAVA